MPPIQVYEDGKEVWYYSHSENIWVRRACYLDKHGFRTSDCSWVDRSDVPDEVFEQIRAIRNGTANIERSINVKSKSVRKLRKLIRS